MIEFDPIVRRDLVAARVAELANAYDRITLRRRLGLRLVAVGLRLAGPRPQGAGSAADAVTV